MVRPFQFGRIPKIYFRPGMISELPALAGKYGKKLVLVTGRKSFLESLYADRLLSAFKKSGISHHIVIIPGEPSPDVIDSAVRKIGNEEFNLEVGIGGGSVLDAGKAISAMLYKQESVIDYLEGVGNKEHPGTKLPFIAIPTTSGTGSEATKNAVISRTGKGGFKRSLRHDNLVPDIALLDPELTLHCPKDITAASGMDCFTQLLEAYLSDKSSEFTDALAVKGLISIKESLLISYVDGEDLEARIGMSFAALTSGICLANAGLGVIHGFASSIGGMYNIPHGIICGTLMAISNEVTVRELRKIKPKKTALEKYATLGHIFLDAKNRSDDYYIDGFVSYLHNMTSELCLPGLKKAGVNEKDLENICDATECKNNPVKIEKDGLMEILMNRFT
jgi:alcohol dehydrogenase class IV